MMKRKIHDLEISVDQDICTGAATCVALAAKAFGLNAANKSILLDTADQETREALIDAARSCPTGAIKAVDEHGKSVA